MVHHQRGDVGRRTLGTQTRHEMQNSVGRGALEQSSSRNKLQQGQANRINALETYPNLLLHRGGACGLAPLYVRGQCERLVAQDPSLRPPSLQRAQGRLRNYNDSDGSGAGRLVCEGRVWAHGGRTCRYWGCSNLEDEMSGAGGDLSSLVPWMEHAVLDVLESCSIVSRVFRCGDEYCALAEVGDCLVSAGRWAGCFDVNKGWC